MRLATFARILGSAGMFSLSIVMLITFMIAYANPDKVVLVTIDEYHEAHVEFVLFIVLIPFMLYTFLVSLFECAFASRPIKYEVVNHEN